MAKRYRGNSGEVRPLPEPGAAVPPPLDFAPPAPGFMPPPPFPPPRAPGLPERLRALLPGGREPLEQEDWLLLLILYLLHRESGDSELLLTIAAYLFL